MVQARIPIVQFPFDTAPTRANVARLRRAATRLSGVQAPFSEE